MFSSNWVGTQGAGMGSNYQPVTAEPIGEMPDTAVGISQAPEATTTQAPATSAASQPGETRHLFVCFFHIFFRAAALVLYLFGSLFSSLSDSFVIVFIILVLLLAADFWTVKNVTGRKLVGLRWWNEVHEDGTNVWRYESIKVRGGSDRDLSASRIVHALVTSTVACSGWFCTGQYSFG